MQGANSGWKQLGIWTNTGTNQSPIPAVISLSPASGSGSNGTFTGLFSHTGGTSQIYLAYVLFLPIPNVVQYTAKGSCLVEYNRISNGVRLINDAGDDWLGPVSGVPVSPSAAALSNSFCTVNVRGVGVAASGSSLAVSVPVTFAPGFSGVLPTFLQSEDVTGQWTGMTQMGSWTAYPAAVQRPGPYYVNATPLSGTGSYTTMNVTVGHSAGPSALSMVHALIGNSITDIKAMSDRLFSIEQQFEPH